MHSNITFRIDKELKRKFIEKCQNESRAHSKVLRNMIRKYIREDEDDKKEKD